jgi:ribonuclease BN (tRNA processing enzyme)
MRSALAVASIHALWLTRGERSFLIDRGASAMIAIRRFGVDPNTINAIILSHLHGDHFGGLPFFILDAQLVSRRTRPLVIAGPRGLRARLDALMEAMFPGSSQVERKFSIELVEFNPETPIVVGGGGPQVTAYVVEHPSGAPSLALRVECGGRVIAYTGDTEWADVLVRVGRDADLLIAEAYWYERKVALPSRFHDTERPAPADRSQASCHYAHVDRDARLMVRG